ncbi:MAG: helix-turn-helix domain-containing protein, partial [Bacteroidetes bacterium]|nr:helix-turn-helix domain-containing protein [Bacteroidota bacterium]
MKGKQNYIKLIFGLKLKQLRQDKQMSLSDLAEKAKLSISYLNEIENGKKYPKADKIAAIVDALGISYDELVSLKLTKNLAPIGELLESNILEQLPLDHYGIDISKIIAQMSNASFQLSALVSTMIEMSRSSELIQNTFSRTALRTFREFHDNYFTNIEEAVEKFVEENRIDATKPLSYNMLPSILIDKYNYDLNESLLNDYDELNDLRAVVVSGKKNILLLNSKLNQPQKLFIVAKELGYNFLSMKKRSLIHSSIKLETFDHLMNNFWASYFATALIINKSIFIGDIELFFQLERWDERKLLTLIDKFQTTPEMFFQRLTSLSTKYLGLNKFFFLRFSKVMGTDHYNLSKELSLNIRRNPGGYQTTEHYCRRWISIDTLKKLETEINNKKDLDQRMTGILHSKFFESEDEFLSISIAQSNKLVPNSLSSVTIGFQVNDSLKKKFKFWNDPVIPYRIVNDTCEMCRIQDCQERVSKPISLEKADKIARMERSLNELKK